jgi:hypothetical protein
VQDSGLLGDDGNLTYHRHSLQVGLVLFDDGYIPKSVSLVRWGYIERCWTCVVLVLGWGAIRCSTRGLISVPLLLQIRAHSSLWNFGFRGTRLAHRR